MNRFRGIFSALGRGFARAGRAVWHRKKVFWVVMAVVVLLAVSFLSYWRGYLTSEQGQTPEPTTVVSTPTATEETGTVDPEPATTPAPNPTVVQNLDSAALEKKIQELIAALDGSKTPIIVNVSQNVVQTQTVSVDGATTSQDQSTSQTSPLYSYVLCSGSFQGLVYENNFNIYKGTIEEASIDHDWRSGGPFGLERFSVKWNGDIFISEPGTYQFKIVTDDKVKLYVDGDIVINQWTSPNTITEYASEPMYLEEGSYKVLMKYFNDLASNSYVKLYYQKLN